MRLKVLDLRDQQTDRHVRSTKFLNEGCAEFLEEALVLLDDNIFDMDKFGKIEPVIITPTEDQEEVGSILNTIIPRPLEITSMTCD